MGIKVNYTGKGFMHPITKQYIAPGYCYEDFPIVDIQEPIKEKNEYNKIQEIQKIEIQEIDNYELLQVSTDNEKNQKKLKKFKSKTN